MKMEKTEETESLWELACYRKEKNKRRQEKINSTLMGEGNMEERKDEIRKGERMKIYKYKMVKIRQREEVK